MNIFQEYYSKLISLMIPEGKIIIVDDVLTLGRTAIASAIELEESVS